MELYPLLFNPVYRNYLWGGDGISRVFGRKTPPPPVAESWELSAYEEGMSTVRNGPLAGKTLQDVVRLFGPRLLGTGLGAANERPGSFPLLLKILDARHQLSVQVHPDNASAKKSGGDPKTELWYVLDASPSASVYAGLRPAVTPEQFKAAVRDGHLEELLVQIPVSAGDAIYVPGGTVHAINAGCLIFEVQQTSNTTYRIFDWNRTDPDGNGRELHVEKALEVIHWDYPATCKAPPRRLGFFATNELWEVVSCPFFRVEKLILNEDWISAMDGRCFHALFCISGAATIRSANVALKVGHGETILMPAALGNYCIVPEPTASFLRITCP